MLLRGLWPQIPPGAVDYPCLIPNWDNTPRSGKNGLVLRDSTPALFRLHVRQVMERIRDRPRDHNLVFIKSWNEWAERQSSRAGPEVWPSVPAGPSRRVLPSLMRIYGRQCRPDLRVTTTGGNNQRNVAAACGCSSQLSFRGNALSVFCALCIHASRGHGTRVGSSSKANLDTCGLFRVGAIKRTRDVDLPRV